DPVDVLRDCGIDVGVAERRRGHIEARRRLAHRPERGREAKLLVSAATPLPFSRIERSRRRGAPHLAPQIAILALDTLDRSAQTSEQRENLRVDSKHHGLLSSRLISEAAPVAAPRAARVKTASEASTPAKPALGLDAGEHGATMGEAERG